ncbi:hypothetical protein [Clostridium pasteurianum]|uniref:Membrane-spanning protein n=1 Tax=Clostridium pasteurianum BC1 TaxID=86416 RepID=R4K1P5_CLOPA|nr:hypothetical protein [Clostridium pasteurianum]AGK96997.1 hypothetical protein Clopa_2118 [Clostridium pasteurianum BC1]
MINKDNKLATGIAVLFELILIVTAITSILSGQWKLLSLSLLSIICLMIPFIITYIANIKNIILPSSFKLITLLFIFFAQYLGEIKQFYNKFWWWDLFLHATFGGYAVIIALYLIQETIRKKQEITKQRFTLLNAIFAFNFSITLGTLWEMFEFIGDYLFKTNMTQGGLEDTSTDLLVNILAAFITSIIYYYRNLRK